MSKTVILTGVRSNAELTLGNLIGAILPLVRLQKHNSHEYQINAFLPDLHSITTPTDYAKLYQNTLTTLRIYAAAGLDLKDPDTNIYRQSFISAHSELTWILDCFIYYGELSRMTQFKEKSANSDSVSASLFNYPTLMAADILLYDASYVPVGEDQRQHLELARDVATRMNNQFGELFVVPKVWSEQLKFNGNGAGERIRSLKHPDQKMSKSISDPSGTILLLDDPKAARDKVLSATTDSVGTVRYDFENQPGVSNLLQIIAALENRTTEAVTKEWANESSYAKLKESAADAVERALSELQSNLDLVSESDAQSALESHETHVRALANEKLTKVQASVGLRP
ncbi:MAG: tryptophan--tRNA ligase [Candidatus Saccharimonadales bacterium]